MPETTLDTAQNLATQLELEELKRLQAFVNALVEASPSTESRSATEPSPTAPTSAAVEEQPSVTTSEDQPRAKGSIEWKLIPDKKTGKTYGPYPYLRWWDYNNKGWQVRRSKYLRGYRGKPPVKQQTKFHQPL
jgi:hypothetical protein